MALSVTRGARKPLPVRPARNVVVFQWPWRMAQSRRWPRGQRPYRRAILVSAPVSSMKISRRPRSPSCWSRQAARSLATSGQALLLRTAGLFLRVEPQPGQGVVHQPEAGADVMLGAASQARNSSRVTSGRLATSARIAACWSASFGPWCERCARASSRPSRAAAPGPCRCRTHSPANRNATTPAVLPPSSRQHPMTQVRRVALP